MNYAALFGANFILAPLDEVFERVCCCMAAAFSNHDSGDDTDLPVPQCPALADPAEAVLE